MLLLDSLPAPISSVKEAAECLQQAYTKEHTSVSEDQRRFALVNKAAQQLGVPSEMMQMPYSPENFATLMATVDAKLYVGGPLPFSADGAITAMSTARRLGPNSSGGEALAAIATAEMLLRAEAAIHKTVSAFVPVLIAAQGTSDVAPTLNDDLLADTATMLQFIEAYYESISNGDFDVDEMPSLMAISADEFRCVQQQQKTAHSEIKAAAHGLSGVDALMVLNAVAVFDALSIPLAKLLNLSCRPYPSLMRASVVGTVLTAIKTSGTFPGALLKYEDQLVTMFRHLNDLNVHDIGSKYALASRTPLEYGDNLCLSLDMFEVPECTKIEFARGGRISWNRLLFGDDNRTISFDIADVAGLQHVKRLTCAPGDSIRFCGSFTVEVLNMIARIRRGGGIVQLDVDICSPFELHDMDLLRDIVDIDISGINVRGEAKALLDACCGLKSINLSGTQLNCTNLLELVSSSEAAATLETIDISRTNATGEACMLNKCRCLKNINLSETQINCKDILPLLASGPIASSVEMIGLFNTNASGDFQLLRSGVFPQLRNNAVDIRATDVFCSVAVQEFSETRMLLGRDTVKLFAKEQEEDLRGVRISIAPDAVDVIVDCLTFVCEQFRSKLLLPDVEGSGTTIADVDKVVRAVLGDELYSVKDQHGAGDDCAGFFLRTATKLPAFADGAAVQLAAALTFLCTEIVMLAGEELHTGIVTSRVTASHVKKAICDAVELNEVLGAALA